MAYFMRDLPLGSFSAIGGKSGLLSQMPRGTTIADGSVVLGSIFSDQLVIGPDAGLVFSGPGRDTLIASQPGNGLLLVGGRGADLYVLGAGVAPVEVRVVFDARTVATGSGDQIVLTEFSADSIVVDLGDGRFEIIDTDGDVLIIEAISGSDTPVDAATFADSLVFAQGSVTEIGGTGGAPRTVIANDVPGTVLTDGDGATTFIVDQSVLGVDAGGGNDVIVVTLDAVPKDSDVPRVFNGGDGDDEITLESTAVLDFALTGDGAFVVDGGTGNDRLSIELAVDGLGRLLVDGGDGDDEIIVDLRGSSDGVVIVDGGAGNDTFIFYADPLPGGPGGGSLTVTTFANEGQDTLIVYTGDPQTSSPPGKCHFNGDGTDGALLTLVLPDFGDTVEVFTDTDGSVVFRDVATGATFGCYFCDDIIDLTARELLESEGFATDFDTILIG